MAAPWHQASRLRSWHSSLCWELFGPQGPRRLTLMSAFQPAPGGMAGSYIYPFHSHPLEQNSIRPYLATRGATRYILCPGFHGYSQEAWALGPSYQSGEARLCRSNKQPQYLSGLKQQRFVPHLCYLSSEGQQGLCSSQPFGDPG